MDLTRRHHLPDPPPGH
ncbi:hypothetical protein E2C01_089785 [Portunus trituberculatus]|uniref:Uncharacterized protein n=1 Tax=Portunus trituberculatus TaxID=210409 RepID=A0A5B7JND3_PORTR|nr:hypothetical protein [Portunus trituberculatus]